MTNMTRWNRILLPALLLVLLCAETAFGYTTTEYTVDVEVGVDNSYLFTETIEVDYDKPQHGIYRYIPLAGMEGQRAPHIDRHGSRTGRMRPMRRTAARFFRLAMRTVR